MVPRRESHINVNVTPQHDYGADTPEIRKYKKRFNSEILCAALWGVNLLIGTENGLMLLDRWSLVLKLNSFVHSCILKSVWFWITQFYVINQTKYSFQVWPGQGLSTYKPTKVPTNGGEVIETMFFGQYQQHWCFEGAGGAEHPCHDQWEKEQSARLLPLLAQEQDTQVSLKQTVFLLHLQTITIFQFAGRRMRLRDELAGSTWATSVLLFTSRLSNMRGSSSSSLVSI